VKHLALNLGAPGDRKDDAGTLWLAYPRPTGSLVLPLKAEAVMLPKGEYFRHSPDFLPINGTPNPWLYTFGACGLKQLAIPLLAEGEDPAPYTVRLGFAEIEEVKPGQRVFSVLLQGKPALKDFDVVKEAGEPRKVVLIECTGVEVSDKLTIDLVSKTAEPSPVQMPILQTVEVLREKMTGFKLSAPSFALSAAVPEQEGQVKIGNYMDGDFAGTLMVESPDGFSLTPDKADAKVAAGSRLKLTLRAAATKKMPPGRYPVVLKLTGPDGRVECEARSEIDYLGDRSRDVFKPVEAATIGPGNRIRPSDKVLFVDGGNKQMGDEAYSMALLKFKIDLPAKPVSVKFRIWDAGNPTSNGGDICQVTTPWSEGSVTYEDRPQLGPVLAHIGRVAANQTMEVPLNLSALSLEGLKELSLAIVPVNCDGVNYVSIKGETPPELEIECER
jgi:hypothetical protein